MRRFFRLLLLILVLVTVFLASAMMSMRLAIHGREVAVPKVIGMTPAEAERSALADGLVVDVEARFYSADIPEGRILSQLPAPGTKVRRGFRIRAAQSLGPQRVSIPGVVGQSPRAAEINLVRRGLQIGTVASVQLPGFAPGQVLAQSPAPNAEGVASPKVNLLESAPTQDAPQFYVMPAFLGRTYGQAHAALIEAGFKVGTVTVVPATNGIAPSGATASAGNNRLKPIATDVIIQQSPAPGQKIAAGAAIGFEVSH